MSLDRDTARGYLVAFSVGSLLMLSGAVFFSFLVWESNDSGSWPHGIAHEAGRVGSYRIYCDSSRQDVDDWLKNHFSLGKAVEVFYNPSNHDAGAPRFLRSDNGPEFVSHAILERLAKVHIDTALNDPGKPWQNGADESFNGKFRDECLSLEWFRSRAEARVIIESWRRHYDHVRPHSSLKELTPIEFKTSYDAVNQGAVLKF